MPANRLGADGFFEIATAADNVLDVVAVGNAGDVLRDNGAFIEIGGGVMGGGADEFDAAGMGLVVGAATGEGGEETVMDVDDGHAAAREEIGAEDLHVAGEHDEAGTILAEDFELAGLGGGLGGVGDGDVVKGKAVMFGGGGESLVIGDDADDLAAHFTGEEAQDEVVKAMVGLGDEEGDAGLIGGKGDAAMHTKLVGGKGAEGCAKDGRVHAGGGSPLETLEEDVLGVVAVLIGVEDVALALVNPAGGTGDEAGLVGSGQEGGQRKGLVSDGGGHERGWDYGGGWILASPLMLRLGERGKAPRGGKMQGGEEKGCAFVLSR